MVHTHGGVDYTVLRAGITHQKGSLSICSLRPGIRPWHRVGLRGFGRTKTEQVRGRQLRRPHNHGTGRYGLRENAYSKNLEHEQSDNRNSDQDKATLDNGHGRVFIEITY